MTPIAERRLAVQAGPLALDARLAVPDGAIAGCVVCHPHPLYGGNMHNPVVVAVVSALQQAGIATLRFDFRGTGESDGIHSGQGGEVIDAKAALDALATETGLGCVAIAGYSFGAWIAMQLAAADPRPAAVAAVAPPLTMVDAAGLAPFPAPLLAIAGDRDSYCPAVALEAFVAGRPGATGRILAGADHFLGGRERELALDVAAFVASTIRQVPSPEAGSAR